MRVLALDIGGTAIKIGVVNRRGQLLQVEERPTLARRGGPAVMQRLLAIIAGYGGIDRIGISAAGQIDADAGRVMFATDNIPGWTGMEIKQIIENRFGIPVAVENDVNAAALGEAHYGAGRGAGSFICLTYGTGIGGAIVENGDLYRGARGSAGEFGHIITHAGGAGCTCGGRGCYEAYASAAALRRKARDKLGIAAINGKEIFRQATAGEQRSKALVDEWLREVVIGLVTIVHTFNPSLIILGGGVMAQDYAVDFVKTTLPEYIMPNFRNVAITKAALGNNAGLLGAAHRALGQEKFRQGERG